MIRPHAPLSLAALLASTAFLAAPHALAADAAAASAPTTSLAEVVVTANKREENLQKAPVAVSAIGAKQVELQGIKEVHDLSALAPNLVVVPGTTNNTAAVVTIRGIPTPADESMGFDSPIGIYLDGVYLGRSAAASFDVSDIERVEVLRGPQGTLFGRNTTGGAINFITRLPSATPSLDLKAGYGNYNAYDVRAIANTGDLLGGTLRMTLGYEFKQRDGTVKNPLETDALRWPGSDQTSAARLAVTFQPVHWLKFINTFDYARIQGVPNANQLTAVGDGAVLPDLVVGGHSFAQVQPANVAGYLAEATNVEAGCGKPLGYGRLNTLCLAGNGFSNDVVWGDMFRIEAELPHGMTLRTTTAYRQWHNTISGNQLDGLGTIQGPLFTPATLLNGMPVGLLDLILPPATAAYLAGQSVPTTTHTLFNVNNDRAQRQFSQEIELLSKSGGAFEWVLGGYFFDEHGAETNPQQIGFVLDTNPFFAGFGPLGPLFAAANPERYRLFPADATLGYSVAAKSYAIYGQGTWRPAGPDGKLGFTLGLRYTWDRKAMAVNQNGAAPFSTPEELAINMGSKAFSAPTGNFTVDYRASDDVNLYARVARGYRSGGFNARQPTNADPNKGPIIPLVPFSDEHIWSYEIGAKTQFDDNRIRLNLAAFYNRYSNQLVTVPIPGGATFGTEIINAGTTDYYGVEAEGQWQLNEYLSLNGNFGWTHHAPKQFPAVDVNGDTANIAPIIVPGDSPEYTADVAGIFTHPITNDINVTARIDWNYVSSQYYFSDPLTAPFNAAIAAKGRGLWNGEIRFDGIRFGGLREGLALTLWAKNIGNVGYVVRGIDFGPLGFGTDIYGDPRTYGVTLEARF